MSPYIIINGVTKNLKGNTVLKDINVTFNSGTISGIKGVNGSGKTMLLRTICGFLQPDCGVVTIGGQKLYQDIDFPPSIGVLIENPAFLDMYTGHKNLQLLASVKKKISGETIRETIRAFGLDPDDAKKYKKYSLGMKQKLGLAAAFMENPDIILLDEPTNALDAEGVELLSDRLRAEKTRGACIVLASHDFQLIQDTCDEIYQMNHGQLCKEGGGH